jgi:hypothetical protein
MSQPIVIRPSLTHGKAAGSWIKDSLLFNDDISNLEVHSIKWDGEMIINDDKDSEGDGADLVEDIILKFAGGVWGKPRKI